ncbi:MAG: sulfotransferase [Proteobacteria bacterium]|nr:sulfotransferase [Pseudomonadota bacterium]
MNPSTDQRDRPILVTGMARSGTSMVAGLLALSGAWVGRTLAGDPHNPKGYFENLALREGVTKRLLHALDCDPLGISKLPELAALPQVEGLAAPILAALEKQGYAGTRPWLFKDAKTALLWPIWRTAFPEARWVIVRRDESGILASCLRTPFMRQHSEDPDFWRAVIAAYRDRLDALVAWGEESGAAVHEIDSDGLVAGDLEQLAGLVAALGLHWDAEAAGRFVAREHWHDG